MPALTFGFVGLGLIGGSIAKAVRQTLPASKIIAYDINSDTLSLAQKEGIADTVLSDIDASFGQCDYLFLCAPVSKNDENLKALAGLIGKNCIITDVGSVKTDIHSHIEALGLTSQFIGGHPMAGSERIGYQNSKAVLLENAYYILTPTKEVSSEKVAAYKDLVETLGAIPLLLTFEEHDYVTAAISHLPHVIASSLVNLVQASDSENGTMKMIAAGGFKDITRIASSSPGMWQQICLTNTENIISLLEDYIRALDTIKEKLKTRDAQALFDFFEKARNYRESFIEASSGPIKKTYSLNVDILDQAGSLASVAVLLADNSINIKNIGIVHNREFEAGTLRIEFYEKKSIEQAALILQKHGYSIHKK